MYKPWDVVFRASSTVPASAFRILLLPYHIVERLIKLLPINIPIILYELLVGIIRQ